MAGRTKTTVGGGNLAMALGDSKSQLIRRALESRGLETPTVDVVASLQSAGVSVSPSQVSRVRRVMRAQLAGTDQGRTPTRGGLLTRAPAGEISTSKMGGRQRGEGRAPGGKRGKSTLSQKLRNALRIPHD